MELKKLVKLSFSRFAKSYNKEAYLQDKSAKDLINLYRKNIEGLGLDLGSGTGYIQKHLRDCKCNLINLDISYEMLKEINKDKTISIQGDIENLPFKNYSFDFILSNFSLHWTDLDKSFNEVYRVLKYNGYFIFNIPIKGSLEFIKFLLKSEKFSFPSDNKVLSLLEEKNLSIEDFRVINYKIKFNNGYSLLLHLHKTGVSLNSKDKSFKKKRYIVEKFKSWNEECFLNYRLLFVKSKKKKSPLN